MIDLTRVSKQYGAIRAVDRVTLNVKKGEAFAILGPSGCGKTTLLRLIAGFERPDSGDIRLGDQAVHGSKTWIPPNMRGIGMIFQDLALWPHMTVSENVTFPLKPRKFSRRERRERAADILGRVGLQERGGHYPHQLSGGEQQRVALARAIVVEPKILLMDEPLASLDPLLKSTLRAMIKRFQKEMGITIVYVTHDRTEATMMADRLAVMRQGVIEQIGSVQQLIDSPRNTFVKSFFASHR